MSVNHVGGCRHVNNFNLAIVDCRYVIDVTHGDYKWTIRRRYKHFRQLHELLLLYRARLKIPVPTKE